MCVYIHKWWRITCTGSRIPGPWAFTRCFLFWRILIYLCFQCTYDYNFYIFRDAIIYSITLCTFYTIVLPPSDECHTSVWPCWCGRLWTHTVRLPTNHHETQQHAIDAATTHLFDLWWLCSTPMTLLAVWDSLCTFFSWFDETRDTMFHRLNIDI